MPTAVAIIEATIKVILLMRGGCLHLHSRRPTDRTIATVAVVGEATRAVGQHATAVDHGCLQVVAASSNSNRMELNLSCFVATAGFSSIDHPASEGEKADRSGFILNLAGFRVPGVPLPELLILPREDVGLSIPVQ